MFPFYEAPLIGPLTSRQAICVAAAAAVEYIYYTIVNTIGLNLDTNTLICIGITFLCIKLSKKNVKNDSEKQLNDINVAKEEKKSIKIPKDSKISIRSLKEKVFSSTFFRKLFMKEVKSKEQNFVFCCFRR